MGRYSWLFVVVLATVLVAACSEPYKPTAPSSPSSSLTSGVWFAPGTSEMASVHDVEPEPAPLPTPEPEPAPLPAPEPTVVHPGTVTDVAGKPIGGVKVMFLDGLNVGKFTFTNADGDYVGAYAFTDALVGNANLSATKVGYAEQILGIYVDGINTLDFVLSAMSTQSPRAVDDNYTVQLGTVLNVPAPGVLANDSIPAGMTVTASFPPPRPPGTLTNTGGGGFTYNPIVDPQNPPVVRFQYLIQTAAGAINGATVTVNFVVDPTKPTISIREVLPASPAGPLPRGNLSTVRVLLHFEQNNWAGTDRMTAWLCGADDRPSMIIRTSCQANSVSRQSPDLYLNPTLGLRGPSDCGIVKVTRLVAFLTPTNETPHVPSPTDPYKSEVGITMWARAERAVDWTYQPCN
ncbi:hypothetical protein A3A05_00580 [Candidatus Nomurabacteria bacterium RIFCSPLOWO2_01_FULL_41_12]|uniref:Uncharacterized protein n=1 Tax=Candidatus Nomurabacteria bacterium RIFCSPLOWO2_01_FULL_41_12 TaxID=1801774 RepID=A0A1F6WWK3_9BACT|nr:MAG: hypothetical protein A2732_00375 [Candidatus Nomurabacteria bacterium RIFCSPHIGHO2_01_FULL_40_10]OGI86248.1 MAG: hypothetical protein A3A05_00580 [Candidatus Nomurabacteria bacterium RIFCSPLOWO2_01_FULL_41_12]